MSQPDKSIDTLRRVGNQLHSDKASDEQKERIKKALARWVRVHETPRKR